MGSLTEVRGARSRKGNHTSPEARHAARIRTPVRGRLHLTLRRSDEQLRSRCEVLQIECCSHSGAGVALSMRQPRLRVQRLQRGPEIWNC